MKTIDGGQRPLSVTYSTVERQADESLDEDDPQQLRDAIEEFYAYGHECMRAGCECRNRQGLLPHAPIDASRQSPPRRRFW